MKSAARRRPSARLRTASRPARFLFSFALCFLTAYALLLTPPVRVADMHFSRMLVQASHLVIVSFGGHARAKGTVLQTPSGNFAVEMQDGCNGINVTILLWSAILAFPASWKRKSLGLAAGTSIILALNTVRFISLYYLGQYSWSWFQFAHVYLWESLLMLDTLIIFGVWVHRVSQPGTLSHAGA